MRSTALPCRGPEAGDVQPKAVHADGFELWADACDLTRTAKAAGRHLFGFAQTYGFERLVLTTHCDPAGFASLGLLAHNWAPAAIAHLFEGASTRRNPLFEATERSDDAVFWNATPFRSKLNARQRLWMKGLAALGFERGVSQRIRASFVPASCSLAMRETELPTRGLRIVMRAAAYAFHHIVALQRPHVTGQDLLTKREYQCLALATISGLRPREVAEVLGVSITTVRSIRQNAAARLGARSPEEVVWRMVETGQLFHPGRTNRPRNR